MRSFNSSCTEDSGFLGCDSVLLNQCFPDVLKERQSGSGCRLDNQGNVILFLVLFSCVHSAGSSCNSTVLCVFVLLHL
jgi:hypothetical protein